MQRLSKERFIELVYNGIVSVGLLNERARELKNFLTRNKNLSVEQMINKLRNNKRYGGLYENFLYVLEIYDGECVENCWCQDDKYESFCYEWLCERFRYNDVRDHCIKVLNQQ